jgi:hypothetical protein
VIAVFDTRTQTTTFHAEQALTLKAQSIRVVTSLYVRSSVTKAAR